jgi:hypothetical protein
MSALDIETSFDIFLNRDEMPSSTEVTPASADKVQSKSTPNMSKLSPSVSFYSPVPSTSTPDPKAPKLILLATWMDARDVHIAKYITHYQVLYPTASILLMKSFFRYYLIPSSARREVAPAVKAILNVLDDDEKSSKQPRMLIHMFSNGGSCTLYHLYDLYKDDSNHHRTLPPHVTIFDSVPGRWSATESPRAILVSLPAGWVRTLGLPFVYLLGLWWVIKYRLLKVPEETHVWGLAHNDPARARETRRSYVYSEADEFVHYRAVEEHADHAEANGYVVVRRDKFSGSQHVAHARLDPDRYWSLVTETWNSSTEVDSSRGHQLSVVE